MSLKRLLKKALERNPRSQPDDAYVVPCDRRGLPVELGEAAQVQFWPRGAVAPNGDFVEDIAIGTLGDLRDEFGV